MKRNLFSAAAALGLSIGGACLLFDIPSASGKNKDDRGKGGEVVMPAAAQDGISVYFSPNGGALAALDREILTAQKSIHVQAAQFTAASLAKSLISAHERGIEVQVIVDREKNADGDSQIDRLIQAGVPTYVDAKHETAHNKVMIFDHHTVTTGSFNFTKQSDEENAENLLVITGKQALADAYEANFAHHLRHSKKYGT